MWAEKDRRKNKRLCREEYRTALHELLTIAAVTVVGHVHQQKYTTFAIAATDTRVSSLLRGHSVDTPAAEPTRMR